MRRRGEGGEDLRERAVGQAEMSPGDRGEDGAVVGRDGEVALLVQRRRREARPLAVNAAAAKIIRYGSRYMRWLVCAQSAAVPRAKVTKSI